MRTEFIEGLIERAVFDDRIVLIVGDLGYSVVEGFQRKFPERFFNAGISEQNMMGMAAGMAAQGFKPFVYSIANFPTFRCAEQIRNDVAYHGLSVTTVSVGGGLVYGNMGYSHHAIQDYALMRSMPEMTILAPGDSLEVASCLDYALLWDGPKYLRLGNPATGQVRLAAEKVELGRWSYAAGDADAKKVILTTGATLELACEWQKLPQYETYQVQTLPAWGMKAKANQAEQFSLFSSVITLEDHLMDGGFGSWLMESLVAKDSSLVTRLDVRALNPLVSMHVAKESRLRELGGLIP